MAEAPNSILDEQTRLLVSHEERQRRHQEAATSPLAACPMIVLSGKSASPSEILPLALLAALAMAATAATTIFVYASLLCKDPMDCQDKERSLYAGAVAVASCAANVGSLLVLGPLERLARENYKAALLVWFTLRSFSVVMLALGYQSRNILVALSGQLFEGFASDNMLHFNLNAVYVQTSDKTQVSRLIGTSLALYMVGISVSPFAAGCFDNVSVSFTIALALFAISLIYIVVYVDRQKPRTSGYFTQIDTVAQEDENLGQGPEDSKILPTFMAGAFSPLQSFQARPIAMIPSFSLLLYNTGQAFIFSAIMVHTSLRFGFSAKQNGFLISIAHATSAAYLFFTLFAVPRITTAWRGFKESSQDSSPSTPQPRTADALFAILSLSIQSISLAVLGLAEEGWQVYPIICFFALGLATPSFIKSHILVLFPVEDAPRAVAALTIMETAGALLAPVILGGFQSAKSGGGVIYVASGIMAASAVVFVLGILVEHMRWPRHRL